MSLTMMKSRSTRWQAFRSRADEALNHCRHHELSGWLATVNPRTRAPGEEKAAE